MKQTGSIVLGLAAFCVAGSLHAGEGDADKLGRLFFTPEQRLALDRLRRSANSGDSAPPIEKLTVDGEVRRSSGKRTVWINKQPLHDGTAESHFVAEARGPAGRIILLGKGLPRTGIAVGWSFLPERQELASPLAGQLIATHRRQESDAH